MQGPSPEHLAEHRALTRRLIWAHFAAYAPAFLFAIGGVPLGILRAVDSDLATNAPQLYWLVGQVPLATFLGAFVLGHLVFVRYVLRGEASRKSAVLAFTALCVIGAIVAAMTWARLLVR